MREDIETSEEKKIRGWKVQNLRVIFYEERKEMPEAEETESNSEVSEETV